MRDVGATDVLGLRALGEIVMMAAISANQGASGFRPSRSMVSSSIPAAKKSPTRWATLPLGPPDFAAFSRMALSVAKVRSSISWLTP
ncbi:MAG: hypothetical protein NTV51_02845 [Verrucomicrobia bacterium]|nr:hypothetical protein [Verrucomicrobiota bacterium]